MAKNDDESNVQRLTTRLIEDQITEAELAELNNLLAGDASRIRQYVKARDIDIAIRLQAWTPRSASQALIIASSAPAHFDVEPPVHGSPDSATHHLRAFASIFVERFITPRMMIHALAWLIAFGAGVAIAFWVL